FSFCKSGEDADRKFFRSVGYAGVLDDVTDVCEVTMLVFVNCLNARVNRAQPGAIDSFKVDLETFDVQQRELFAQRSRIDTRRDHRAENHVAASTRETIEIESLHKPICGTISPALPVITSSQRPESGVRSGFTSQTYAPDAFAIPGSPAAG